jgi:tetratricopeptide (TPR) repeat protein
VSDIYSYRLGLEYFQKEKYSAAQKEFEQAILDIKQPNAEISINAEYFAALCAIELFHRDAALRLKEFIRAHPESPKVLLAKFKLATYYYRKSQWKEVIAWFEQIDPMDLDKELRFERDFKLGYAYFQTKEFELAATRFFELKDINNPYATPARYYFAHIAYQDGNLETAYTDFKKLDGDPTFGKLVPYYLSQILHQQKKFDELLAYAPPLLDSVSEKRRPEMARLIGDAWYGKGDFGKALPFLEEHDRATQTQTNDGRYQLAYCYFKTGDCDKAAPLFNRLITTQNEVAQLSAYHLGECYRLKNEKGYARSAYLKAAEFDFDASIKEDATFNAAVMGYESAADPFGKAAKAFESFIVDYPESDRVEDAYNFLTAIYLTGRNYEAALKSIDRMQRKTPEVRKAYQSVAFNRGVELYQNRSYDEALSYFERSGKYPEDPMLTASARYWIAETYFRQKNIAAAIRIYKEFQFMPAAILTPHFYESNYSIGYGYFQSEEFKEAISWFRKFIYRKEEADSVRINDALLRTGDAYFVLKQYDYALDFYRQAASMQNLDADYALFQQALCQGILKDHRGRSATLVNLTQSYPMSAYYEPALYELGRTQALLNNSEAAQMAYAKAIQEGNNALYVKKSLIASGLLYYNKGETENALRIFTRVVKEYPTYEDTHEALKVLKSIYIDRGEVEAYSALVEGLGFGNVTQSELDSALFETAELRYMEGDCQGSMDYIEQYLAKFDPALFETKARNYLADCAYRNNLFDKAIVHYAILATDTAGAFTETANLRMSEMRFEKDPAGAYPFFQALRKHASSADNRRTAILGIIDCQYRTDNKRGNRITALEALELKVTDNYYIGLSHLFIGIDCSDSNNKAAAIQSFIQAASATRSEVSAEARYRAARLYFESDSMEQAEAMVFELVNQVPSYGFWVAKGLILLSEVYLATDKVFQAKAALQSVIENYEGADLKNDAENRLKALEQQEQKTIDSAPKPEEIREEFVLPPQNEQIIDYEEIDLLYLPEEESNQESEKQNSEKP